MLFDQDVDGTRAPRLSCKGAGNGRGGQAGGDQGESGSAVQAFRHGLSFRWLEMHRRGGKPRRVLVGIEPVMTQPSSGALWQVPGSCVLHGLGALTMRPAGLLFDDDDGGVVTASNEALTASNEARRHRDKAKSKSVVNDAYRFDVP
jgi:hypothetical protein